MAPGFKTGLFIISLDFELYWGVRDKRSVDVYGEQLRHTREAVLALLSLFQEFDVHATWCTVGLLFQDSREQLLGSFPERLPGYTNSNLCPYRYIEESLVLEPEIHFAPDLIRVIANTAGQEVGTHTYSHFYCLEEGVTPESFSADLKKAVEVGRTAQLPPCSLVFPRNQWRREFLDTLSEFGIVCFRGTERHPVYRPVAESQLGYTRRGLKLLDSYLNLTGDHTFTPRRCGEAPFNLPASRFLRPWTRRLKLLEPLRKRRIVQSMRRAASRRRAFHLWWHPHNFGKDLDRNLSFLRTILNEYQLLSRQFGFRSLNMREVAEGLNDRSILED